MTVDFLLLDGLHAQIHIASDASVRWGRASVSGKSHGGRADGPDTLVNALMLVGFGGN